MIAVLRLGHRPARDKRVTVHLSDESATADLGSHAEVVQRDGPRVVLRCAADRTSDVIRGILAAHAVTDLTVEDAPLDEVMRQVFRQQVAS